MFTFALFSGLLPFLLTIFIIFIYIINSNDINFIFLLNRFFFICTFVFPFNFADNLRIGGTTGTVARNSICFLFSFSFFRFDLVTFRNYWFNRLIVRLRGRTTGRFSFSSMFFLSSMFFFVFLLLSLFEMIRLTCSCSDSEEETLASSEDVH